MRRISEAQVVCFCDAAAMDEVAVAIQGFLDTHTFDPPPAENHSLFIGGSSSFDDGDAAIISAWGLDDQIGAISHFLEDHPKYRDWGIWFEWDHPDYVLEEV